MDDTTEHRAGGLLAAALLALSLAGAPGARAAQPLTGDQIRELLPGNTLNGNFFANQLTIAFYPDGKLVGTLGLHGSDVGSWSIKEQLYCHSWTRYFGAEERCYEWVPQADGYLVRNADAFRTHDFQGRITRGFPPGY